MTYRVIITPEAEKDLRAAYRYIRRQAPEQHVIGFGEHAKPPGALRTIPGVALSHRRAFPSTNPSVNCFLVRATEAPIDTSSPWLANPFTCCT